MSRPAIIFDRDGTLASVQWARHFVAEGAIRKDWAAFNSALPYDAPVPNIAALFRAIKPGIARLVTTGRTEDNRRNMLRWFRQHDLNPTKLYMRSVGDQRKDSLVKLELLDRIRADGYDVLYVIDDRPEVVAAWRSVGLKVLQVVDPGIEPGLFEREVS